MFTRNTGFKLKLIDLSDNTTVTAAGTNTQTLTPPSGKIYEIVRLIINIPDPAGSSAGTQMLAAHYDNSFTSQSRIFQLNANFGGTIITYVQEFMASNYEDPSNAREQQNIIQGGVQILANNTNTIKFVYTNSTDVSQTGTRTIKVLVKEYNEVG